MTEIPICHEGKRTADGRTLLPGSVVLPTEPVPVTHQGTDGSLVGLASDWRRDEDGVVYARVLLLPGTGIDLRTVNTHLALRDSTAECDAVRGMEISNARVEGLYLSPGPHAWPDLDVNKPDTEEQAFKDAWHAADERGERVTRGLEAAATWRYRQKGKQAVVLSVRICNDELSPQKWCNFIRATRDAVPADPYSETFSGPSEPLRDGVFLFHMRAETIAGTKSRLRDVAEQYGSITVTVGEPVTIDGE